MSACTTPGMNLRTTQGLGWRPQLPDHRDLRLAAFPPSAPLPAQADLSPQFPACYDQGQLLSYTANALAAIVQFNQRHSRLSDFMPSRPFI